MQRNGKRVQAPERTMQVPEGTMQVPAMSMQAPAMSMEVTETPLQAPAMMMHPSARSRRSVIAYRADTPIERRLLTAQMALDEVLADAALQAALAPRGYDQARLLEGRALRDTAQALAQQQRARTGDQRRAKAVKEATKSQAHAFFKSQVDLARTALRDDPGAAEALDLGVRKRSSAGWLAQAQQFYANALNDPAILGKLATFGITREELEQGQSQVEAVVAGAVTHQQRKGVKQETTRARDAALAALDRWMQDFNAVVRVALARLNAT